MFNILQWNVSTTISDNPHTLYCIIKVLFNFCVILYLLFSYRLFWYLYHFSLLEAIFFLITNDHFALLLLSPLAKSAVVFRTSSRYFSKKKTAWTFVNAKWCFWLWSCWPRFQVIKAKRLSKYYSLLDTDDLSNFWGSYNEVRRKFHEKIKWFVSFKNLSLVDEITFPIQLGQLIGLVTSKTKFIVLKA